MALSKKLRVTTGILVALGIVVAIALFDLAAALPVPGPPQYQQGVGGEFCAALAASTQRVSFWLLILGWSGVLGSTLLAFAGSILGTSKPSDPDAGIWAVIKGHRGLACTSLAVLLGSSGGYLLSRSNDSTLTARAATHAIASAVADDLGAYSACAHAKGLWLEGRTNQQQLKDLSSKLSDKNRSLSESSRGERSADPGAAAGILKEEREIEKEDGEI